MWEAQRTLQTEWPCPNVPPAGRSRGEDFGIFQAAGNVSSAVEMNRTKLLSRRFLSASFTWLALVSSAYAEPISVSDISVVDGDTIDAHGHRYRMIGYDTPEIATRRRKVGPAEKAVAAIAKERFAELLNSGSLDLQKVPCSCSMKSLREGTCNHGRKCAILSLNGKNIGDTLIAEELAVPYVCTETKCPRMPDWPRIIEKQFR